MNYSSRKLYKLRKTNSDLFDQLESNSALLENKLRKLKESTRSSRDFMQLGQSSSLKKRRRSWKMRNDLGEMSEVMKSEFTMQRNSNYSTAQAEILQGEDNTPSVKSKGKKLDKGIRHSFPHNCNANRVSQQQNYSEKNYNVAKDKRNEFLYNAPKNSSQINHKNQHLKTSNSEEDTSLSKHKALNAQSKRNNEPDKTNDKLLQEVGNIIDYSPKSTFLQRLKQRSQRNVCNSYGSPRKAVCIKSRTPGIMPLSNTLKKDDRRNMLSTGENQMKSSLKETAKSPNSCYFAHYDCSSPCNCAHNIVSNTPTLKKEIPTVKQKKNRIHLKKKRVCYRRNCYCHKALQGKPPGNKKTSAKKENLPHTANEVDRSPNASSFSSRKCCNLCFPHSAHSKLDNAAVGRIPSIRSVEESSCCTCQKTGPWFNSLKKFRDSHWFDCHAKPISVCLDPNEHRILQNHCKCYEEDQHTCVHQYVVNDRLFMQPVCADHKGRSRCVYCKLPRKQDQTSNILKNKTKSSMEEVFVSLPLSLLSPEKDKNCKLSNTQDESTKARYKRSVRQKRSPPPANSLALRFQKGVL